MPETASRLPSMVAVRTGGVSASEALRKLIGQSGAMQQVRGQIQRIARSPVPVLIVGETGTGKELCAEAMSLLSGRTPFIAVNCAALPESLVESELFGHERGAFTGAVQARAGMIAAADGGTLFLDELAEVPTTVQAKLLRTLESGEYRPLGSTKTLTSRFRILAATSGDLERIISAGHLRVDLFHRLGAVRVRLPPLRERLEDIPVLAAEFLRRYLERCDCGPANVSPEASTVLMQQDWPGNVRQLRNVVEAAAAVAGLDPVVGMLHVVEVLASSRSEAPPVDIFPSLAEARTRAEEHAIIDALQRTAGNRERAAKLLRISEATLYRKLGRRPPTDSILTQAS